MENITNTEFYCIGSMAIMCLGLLWMLFGIKFIGGVK